MTLILGMSKAEGIYVSVDYRVTVGRSGRLINDESIKFLQVIYPPDPVGPKVLLSFIGLAILPDGTPTGTWLRETLRGETEDFDTSMAHLRERLDRDVASTRVVLTIHVLAIHQERRYFGVLTNQRRQSDDTMRVVSRFRYGMRELDGPFAFSNGSGTARALADGHLEQINTQSMVTPRKPDDHMKLLATINRRVAAKEDTVSPFSQVSFVNADDRFTSRSKCFLAPGETAPFEMPILWLGVDGSIMAKKLHEATKARRSGDAPEFKMNWDGIEDAVERRP